MDSDTAPHEDPALLLDTEPASNVDSGAILDTEPALHDNLGANLDPPAYRLVPSSGNEEELRCVNCGIGVMRRRRRTLELAEVQSVIQQWTAPQLVTAHSLVCHSCWMLAFNHSSSVQENDQSTSSGHRRQLCVNCQSSILRTRSHVLHTNTERETHIRNVISEWIAPRQVHGSDRICHPCWQRADRVPVPSLAAANVPTSTGTITLLYMNNTLADFVIQNNLNRRRTQFVNINVNINNVSFPRLTYSDLILFGCGTYQLKQARSYYGEHIRNDGSYTIEISMDRASNLLEGLPFSGNCTLLRGKIQSRHISRKIYFVYILYNNNQQGREAITQYYCNCLVGRRTVGCCAHVMTIVWYLSWARHENNITPPAQFLDNILIIYDSD